MTETPTQSEAGGGTYGPRPDGRTVAAAIMGGNRVWRLDTDPPAAPADFGRGSLYAVAISPDGQTEAMMGGDGPVESGGAFVYVILRNVSTGERNGSLRGPGPIRSIGFSPDGRLLAAGGTRMGSGGVPTKEGWLTVWETATRQEHISFRAHGTAIQSVVFSPDGKILATAALGGGARLWHVITGL